jgi:rhodanese-related sulfurtransferase
MAQTDLLKSFSLCHMKTTIFLALLCSSSLWAGAAERELDTNAIQTITGLSGKMNAEEGVFKVSSPRNDVKVSVDKWQMPPFMGLTSWAAFKAGMKEQSMVMGDLVLFQDEVNPVMSAALENGLQVTALHNHFFYDNPKVYFMHIGGEGKTETLAQGVKAALAKVKEVRSQNPPPSDSFAGQIPSPSSITAEALQKIFGTKGDVKDGMAKFVFGRAAKMPCGCDVGKEMGVNTWAAFAGSDDNAVVDGDFVCREEELQATLKSVRKAGINVVAIHHHMAQEQPRYIFFHYWGRGKAADLANAVKIARGEQTKAAAAAARLEGGFKEIRAAQFEKERKSRKAVILDVRTPDEFARGHIPGALNLDINSPAFFQKAAQLDKKKTILVNCHSGSRGAIASAELAKMGFKTVCNLEGGLDAWEKDGHTAESSVSTPPQAASK